MIPRRIAIRNFLSYRKAELDLSGLHLAVLCGRNGDGKSALLDAMTWAIWGEARGAGDADRIYMAEAEMMVDLEFEAGGDRFRVVRRKTRNRRAADLQFFQMGEMGQRTLTGGTMTETEREIRKRVGMDYATFAASAFVAQGHAGEFTSKRPAERKDVFRKILGLELYERLADAAKDRRKEAEQALRSEDGMAQGRRERVARKPEVEAERVEKQATLDRAREVIRAADDEVAGLREASHSFERLRDQLTSAARSRERLEREIEGGAGSLNATGTRLESCRETLREAEAITTAYERLGQAREREAELSRSQAAAAEAERRASHARTSIAAERARLETGLAAVEREVAEAAAIIEGAGGIEAQQRALKAEALRIEALLAAIAQVRERATLARSAAQVAAARQQEAAAKGKELQTRRLAVKELQQAGGAMDCPVCRRPLDAAGLDHVLAEYSAQIAEARAHFDEAKTLATTTAAAAAEAETAVADAERGHQQAQAGFVGAERELGLALGRLDEARARIPELERRRDSTVATLGAEHFAREARADLAAAERDVAATGYDPAEHERARQEVHDLRAAEARHGELQAARQLEAQLQAQVESLTAQLARWRDELGEATQAEAQAGDELTRAEDVGPRLQELEANLAALRAEEASLNQRLGALAHELAEIEHAEAQLAASGDRQESLREEAGTFSELEQAFGKDGVQAVLIEQSLPLVEQVANEMLDRMTNGRIQVQLATQKETAAGRLVETLDIRISDELGVRAYEMYSGGEAFRVDFALRIALAKLLAQRAGAELPLLIIDEGFGSQDAEGIERLVDAINTVSQEFELILVVTHVEELKNYFPRRIEVTKDPQQGSKAVLV